MTAHCEPVSTRHGRDARVTGRRAGAARGRRTTSPCADAPRANLPCAVLPLAVLVTGAVALRPVLPAWAAMWAIAFAVFFGCKWLTWHAEAPAGVRRSPRHAAAYLFAWTGMDPAAFLARSAKPEPGRGMKWAATFAHIGLGAALLWGVARHLAPAAPLLAGWAGMVGIVLLLHFGAFDLIALAWQSRGFDARTLMNAPTRSAGLSDFWSNRWNTAFNHLAGRYVFAPLARRLGPAGATLATFLASGLVHDLVISVPARAGYGLPTAYFLLQGAGVLLDRAWFGRERGRNVRRRLLAAAVVLTPLPLLFPDPFVRRVILPFLQAVGAA